MTDALASFADLRALFGVAIAATAMVWAGRLLVGHRAAPEICLLAGWGALCGILTLWSATTPYTLYLPIAGCFLAALAGLRHQGQVEGSIWRVALLSLPVWAVMASARPSQVDTWLNLLPNQAFLVDHALLPRDGGPPHHSFLPGAPYNTQFAAFAASLVSGGLASNAMALFNILLICAAGLKLGRVAAGRDGLSDPLPVPWWACAAGLLLAVPLNPGFVPRVFFTGYGEAPLAVVLMFAVGLSADLLIADRRRAPVRGLATALALTLMALVEIKQSSLGLLLPLAACLLGLGLTCPGIRRLRWCGLVAGAVVPSLVLYVVWRWYVDRHFAVGELKILPASDWHWALLPGILRAIAGAALQKPAYFLALLALLALVAGQARRDPWTRPTLVLVLAVGLVLGFTGFLLATYVAHFPAGWALHAHSFFRYMSQLSLVTMLCFTHLLRGPASAWLTRRTRQNRRRMAAGAIGAVMSLPLLLAPLLRFDLDLPQPVLWTMAHRAAAYLHDGETLALVVPGDNDDAVASMLRGTLLFTPPRRSLTFRTELTAGPVSLIDAAQAGASHALVTCSGDGLGGLPARVAGLLVRDGAGWHVQASWPYPPGLSTAHFSAMMPHAPFCGTDQPPT